MSRRWSRGVWFKSGVPAGRGNVQCYECELGVGSL